MTVVSTMISIALFYCYCGQAQRIDHDQDCSMEKYKQEGYF